MLSTWNLILSISTMFTTLTQSKILFLSSEVEPVGGAARFVHLVKKLREENKNTLVLFSGDIFSPMSTLFKGEHMLPIIDEINIDVACVGNHDYDFGINELEKLVTRLKRNFPWLLSNFYQKDSSLKIPMAPGKEYHTLEINGIKIGFIGLIEYEWILTQNKINKEDFIYVDFIEKAKELSYFLRVTEKCDMIIALTHMRTHNEEILCKEVSELDLILGGHDHFFFYKAGKGNVTIKSGTDFRELTFNKIKFFKKNSYEIENLNEKRIKCYSEKLSEKDYFALIDKQEYSFSIETELMKVHKLLPEDDLIKEFANLINEKTKEKFNTVIGRLANRVDAQFLSVRRNSLPISNFVTDLLRIYMNTDCAILNSGSLRIDSYINEGQITRLLPGDYNVVRLRAKGSQILNALQNGITKFPALEGRFPMISGLKFTFCYNRKSHDSPYIDLDSVTINGNKLELEKEYTLATREYLYTGCDGYDQLPNCINIDDTTDITTLFDIVLKYFEIVKRLKDELYENEYFEPGIFGFDTSNKSFINYIRETVIIENGTPQVMITSPSRINIIDI